MSFTRLNLNPVLVEALDALNHTTPTPIQQQSIPPILANSDLLATAQTGSGKTVAYVIPLLHRWVCGDPKENPRTLVLVPTRELAQQVAEVLQNLATRLKPKPSIVTVYGGVSINPQLMALRGGADFVVATPGRLLDVIAHNGLNLQQTNTLVLDEVDRLLSQGFSDELEALLCALPDSCQTLMFTATLAGKVQTLAKHLLDRPVRIALEDTNSTIEQRAIEVDAGKRLEVLLYLLDEYQGARALVFCATRTGAQSLATKLQGKGVRAAVLSSRQSQAQRDAVLEGLKLGLLDALVATDLAARGLDVELLPLVFNYDLPRSPQDYTHRIGRTGRAGKKGVAISFVDADSHAHFKLIENRVGVKMRREQITGLLPVDYPTARLLVSDSNGGIKGKRPSKKDRLRAASAEKPNEK